MLDDSQVDNSEEYGRTPSSLSQNGILFTIISHPIYPSIMTALLSPLASTLHFLFLSLLLLSCLLPSVNDQNFIHCGLDGRHRALLVAAPSSKIGTNPLFVCVLNDRNAPSEDHRASWRFPDFYNGQLRVDNFFLNIHNRDPLRHRLHFVTPSLNGLDKPPLHLEPPDIRRQFPNKMVTSIHFFSTLASILNDAGFHLDSGVGFFWTTVSISFGHWLLLHPDASVHFISTVASNIFGEQVPFDLDTGV